MNNENPIIDVAAFMAIAGQIDVNNRNPDPKLVRFQISLMMEELGEMAEELPELFTQAEQKKFKTLAAKLRKNRRVEPLKTSSVMTDVTKNSRLIDHFIDAIWVTIGALIATGCQAPQAWDEVVRANMGKFHVCPACNGEDNGELCTQCNDIGSIAVRDNTGKVVKPDGWTPPSLEQFVHPTIGLN